MMTTKRYRNVNDCDFIDFSNIKVAPYSFQKLQMSNTLTVLNVVFLSFMQQISGCSSILMFRLSNYVSFGNT
jgi:hypothetical protein